jgi:hypothetical protein
MKTTTTTDDTETISLETRIESARAAYLAAKDAREAAEYRRPFSPQNWAAKREERVAWNAYRALCEPGAR